MFTSLAAKWPTRTASWSHIGAAPQAIITKAAETFCLRQLKQDGSHEPECIHVLGLPHSTLHATHSTLHTLHFPLYTLYSSLDTPPHSTLYTLHTPHSALYTPHFTLHTLHSSLHTPHSTLYTPQSEFHTPHFTLYTPHSTLYTPHSMLDTLHSTLHTLNFTLYTLHSTLHSTLHTPHSTFHTPHSTFYTPRSTLYTLHSRLHTLHFPLHTPHSTLYTQHSTLYTVHSSLHPLHFALYTPHSTLYTPHSTKACTKYFPVLLCTTKLAQSRGKAGRDSRRDTWAAHQNEHFVRDFLWFWYFRHGIRQVGMSQSATPATQNDMTTCVETFEKERFCSFPHRHGINDPTTTPRRPDDDATSNWRRTRVQPPDPQTINGNPSLRIRESAAWSINVR